MAGNLQLETYGVQEKFFTINPEFSHFTQPVKKTTNFSREYIDVKPEKPGAFGTVVSFKIPHNMGDLLGNISLRLKLSRLPSGYIYIESAGHAIIDYIELSIYGKVIQRINSDYLEIYAEHNVTQTKQKALKELVGKYAERINGLKSSLPAILTSNDYNEFLVNIPFYFYNNPELYIPLCALKKQEVEVKIKLKDYRKIVLKNVSASYPTIDETPTSTIEDMKLHNEIIFLDTCDRIHIEKSRRDYIITEIQEKFFEVDPSVDIGTFKLEFKNPVKELYFIIQRIGDDIFPFDYDNENIVSNDRYNLYENLEYLTLDLDGESILTKDTGTVLFLKSVQGTIHHSKTQLLRRFYSYSFAMEPEKWYPTGQINFSGIKEQILKMKLTPSTRSRQVRVYALSYNILRVEDGLARLLF